MIMEYILFAILTIFLFVILRYRVVYFRKGLNLNAFDGLFFGGIFYMFIPLAYYIIIQYKDLDDVWVILPKIFRPLDDDVLTTIYVFMSLFLFGILSVHYQRKKKKEFFTYKQSVNEKFLFFTILILYVVSQIIFLLKSGKLEGGAHWYESNAVVYNSGAIFSLIGQFNNVGRLMLPTMAMYFELRYNSKKYFYLHIIVSAILVLMELILTGNRIAMLYVGVSHLIPFLYQKKYKYIFLSILVAIPIYTVASLWPLVRGLMWTDKISIEHIEYIYETTRQAKATESHDPVFIFTEGINLFVLNYIINTYPEKYDFTYGKTMVIKSAGTLIPKKIWQDKPDGVGREMGRQLLPRSDYIVLNPSLIGETWVNFGYFGNILLVFFVLLFFFFYPRYISRQLYMYMLFFVAIAVWRFDSSFFFVAFYTILIYMFISSLSVVRFCLRKLIKGFSGRI